MDFNFTDDYFDDEDILLASEHEKVYLRCTIRTKDEEIAKLKSELAKVKEQLKKVKQNSAKVITRLCEQKYK